MYWRQHGDHYGIGNYRHEPLLVEPEAIRPPGIDGHPATLPFTAEHFDEAHTEAGRLVPALADVPIVDSFNGLMAFPPDGLPLLGASRVRGLWLGQAIWVTHAGGAGRALADLMVRGAHRRRPARVRIPTASRATAPAARTGAPAARQQYREVYDILHPRQQSEQARPLRRTPLYDREVALGAHFFESAGWERAAVVRGQRGAGARCAAAVARLAGAPLVADRDGRAPGGARARRDVRPLAVHEDRGPRTRRARLPPAPGRQRRRPPGRRDRLHRDALAARDDHVRPDDHAHRRGSLPGRHRRRGRAATTWRGCGALCPRTARSRSRTARRRSAAWASGGRERATCWPRSPTSMSRTRRFPS